MGALLPVCDWIELALEQIMASFIKVVERQLADFLPGGKYGQEVSQPGVEIALIRLSGLSKKKFRTSRSSG